MIKLNIKSQPKLTATEREIFTKELIDLHHKHYDATGKQPKKYYSLFDNIGRDFEIMGNLEYGEAKKIQEKNPKQKYKSDCETNKKMEFESIGEREVYIKQLLKTLKQK